LRRKGFCLFTSQLDDLWSAVGPHLDRESFATGAVEGYRKSLHIGREEVPVTIHRHRNRRVTEVDLDRLGVRPLGDEQRCTRMPQVVDAEPLG
jgi:hypothetical protein